MTNGEAHRPMENLTVEEKLAGCISTRSFAAQSFCSTLGTLLQTENPISEAQLRDDWLAEMRKNTKLYPDGWYDPPPSGIGVLFGTEENYSRMNYKSLRPEEMHPKDNIFLDREKGVVYIYASTVDKDTGMIGDWGMTLYFGDNPEIKKHLQQCLALNRQVFDHTEVGITTFAELTQYAYDTFSDLGLSNEVTSITDPTGVNIGHTVPGSYEDWTRGEIDIFNSGDWEKILTLIKNKRKFLSTQEALQVKPGMAFTIEQRLTKPANPIIPMSSFHTIAVFYPNGNKELLTNFDEVFKLISMDYMLNINHE